MDDYYDEETDIYHNDERSSPSGRFMSHEEQELKDMTRRSEAWDSDDEKASRSIKLSGTKRDQFYDDDELEFDDDEELSDGVGNYWSNAVGGIDSYPLARPSDARTRQWRDRERPSPTAQPHQRGRSRRSRSGMKPKTTFRSGTPSAPQFVIDFYNRLFWFGFESLGSDETLDTYGTKFGGTRGKFNALALAVSLVASQHRGFSDSLTPCLLCLT